MTIIAGFFITFMNLIVDILYAFLDPRVRYVQPLCLAASSRERTRVPEPLLDVKDLKVHLPMTPPRQAQDSRCDGGVTFELLVASDESRQAANTTTSNASGLA